MIQKRILDSVHGNIYVDSIYFNHLIDTPEFQRLRRIEQTSIRSIFPSARHDRFIHSIGVYHIGTLFTSQLYNDAIENDWFGITETKYQQIVESYHIACLLHDIAHAPFSHTFEKYFGRISNLKKQLKQAFGATCPIDDKDLEREANFHEYASAILVLQKFSQQIKTLGADKELVVRMIIGCVYSRENDVLTQIKNCFITLLNGGIIDADRLDYACRDVWASGYSTSSIDVSRLVSGLHISMNKDGKYEVCYRSNVLNEIKGVLDVKEFQTKHVIHHHTVVYEQEMLVRAAEQMALEMLPDNIIKKINKSKKGDRGTLALEKIISLQSLTENSSKDAIKLNNGNVISYITDDDLVYLMKNCKDNDYYKQWASRQYSMFALWKTPDEFYYYYPEIASKTISKNLNDCQEMLTKTLSKKGYKSFIVKLEEFKPRVRIDKLKILIGKDLIDYSLINHEQECSKDETTPFFYIYISKQHIANYDNIKVRVEQKEQIIESLKTTILSMYKN